MTIANYWVLIFGVLLIIVSVRSYIKEPKLKKEIQEEKDNSINNKIISAVKGAALDRNISISINPCNYPHVSISNFSSVKIYTLVIDNRDYNNMWAWLSAWVDYKFDEMEIAEEIEQNYLAIKILLSSTLNQYYELNKKAKKVELAKKIAQHVLRYEEYESIESKFDVNFPMI